MRRMEAYRGLLDGLANRAPASGNVEFISMAKATQLMEEYKQARDEGYTDDQLEIIPLSSYHTKLFPEGKKPIRPLLENEWGTIHQGRHAGTILCIRDAGLGIGQTITSAPVPGLLPGPGKGGDQ